MLRAHSYPSNCSYKGESNQAYFFEYKLFAVASRKRIQMFFEIQYIKNKGK